MPEHVSGGEPPIGNLAASKMADVVMKGGITSGIIYPPAVCELSRSYLFRSIGGTSAGAIAAALTAAAEYRRRGGGSDEGFRKLAALPEELAAPGYILNLFRPDRSTRGLFNLFVALAKRRHWWSRLAAAIWSGVRTWPWAVLGAAPGLLLIVAMRWGGAPMWAMLASVAAGAALALVGLLVALGIGLLYEAVTVDRNFFGLCRGIARAPKGEPASLTTWLADQIDALAGMPEGRPLTFGDLWDAPLPPDLKAALNPKDFRSIDLRTVTTCLTQGRPYSIPFLDPDVFFYSPAEFKRLFPARIVDWMVAHSDGTKEKRTATGDRLLPLPDNRDIPVIVAARMSLSFPVLISAVPLWGYDYALEVRKGRDGQPGTRHPHPCWFSDGGITSNFPVHLFDSVVPRWPTFGLNLRYFPKDKSVPCAGRPDSRVYLPKRNSDGALESWAHLSEHRGVRRIEGFLGLIQSAMQSWNDNSYLHLPGYRDRVAEIWLQPDEGGMNLDMGDTTVRALATYGRQAGELLRGHFANPHNPETNPMSWDNHRKRRAHGGLAAVRQVLLSIRSAAENPIPGDTPLERLLEPGMHEGLRRVAALGSSLEAPDPFDDPPRPTVELRSRAPR